ncbi:MAG: hypothetical protein VKJ46_16220 [Leptolyngbyaceae bacterium]|nr:hypothetical protein [Leptolyngbyaceae bacterium]
MGLRATVLSLVGLCLLAADGSSFAGSERVGCDNLETLEGGVVSERFRDMTVAVVGLAVAGLAVVELAADGFADAAVSEMNGAEGCSVGAGGTRSEITSDGSTGVNDSASRDEVVR